VIKELNLKVQNQRKPSWDQKRYTSNGNDCEDDFSGSDDDILGFCHE
jgi:hypothetical protein